MREDPSLEKCFTFVSCQLQPLSRELGNGHRPIAVTFSREGGCGAHAIAEKLAARLQELRAGNGPAWQVIDRSLVEKVLGDHQLPVKLAKFMPEDRISEIDDTIDELCGLHPPSWILVRHTAETIVRLAKLGNVIIIGRAGNVITSGLDHVLHVRLIAPFEVRLENIQRYEHLGKKAAVAFLRRQDTGRRRYLKKYFHKNVDDPLLYHLVLNVGLLDQEKVVEIIAAAVCRQQGIASAAA